MSREQRQHVREMAERFAQRHIAPLVEHSTADTDGAISALFQAGQAAGFDRIALDEDSGGFGFGLPELCILTATLAETSASFAMRFAIQAAVVTTLNSRFCELEIEIEIPLGLVLGEPTSMNDFDHLTSVDIEGDVLVPKNLGPMLAVNAAAGEDVLWCTKDVHGSAVLLLIDPAEMGWSLNRETSLGLDAMPVGFLQPVDGRATAGWQVLERGKAAHELYGGLFANLCLVSAAVASGLAKNAHQRALAYAAARYQGGQQIIDHSHLRTILGAMAADGAVAQTAVLGAATDFSHRQALATKISISDRCVKVCTDAVQLLGGYGYMKDYGLEGAMRDAATLSLLPMSNARAELLLAAVDRALVV